MASTPPAPARSARSPRRRRASFNPLLSSTRRQQQKQSATPVPSSSSLDASKQQRQAGATCHSPPAPPRSAASFPCPIGGAQDQAPRRRTRAPLGPSCSDVPIPTPAAVLLFPLAEAPWRHHPCTSLSLTATKRSAKFPNHEQPLEPNVDGLVKCEKWIRDDGERLEESKSSWWLNQLIGHTKTVSVDWPYPFVEDRLFVLTLTAGLEGYHGTVRYMVFGPWLLTSNNISNQTCFPRNDQKRIIRSMQMVLDMLYPLILQIPFY
ncbi:hypothetical protein U9M48_030667 [Paspalum notatum var. saurae]|uniref:Uncharacterized protein n=1 Tax=Paspalum notatum var. saurae TaxID=547442 RepID=A0AAQ3X3Z4_PASNO